MKLRRKAKVIDLAKHRAERTERQCDPGAFFGWLMRVFRGRASDEFDGYVCDDCALDLTRALTYASFELAGELHRRRMSRPSEPPAS